MKSDIKLCVYLILPKSVQTKELRRGSREGRKRPLWRWEKLNSCNERAETGIKWEKEKNQFGKIGQGKDRKRRKTL